LLTYLPAFQPFARSHLFHSVSAAAYRRNRHYSPPYYVLIYFIVSSRCSIYRNHWIPRFMGDIIVYRQLSRKTQSVGLLQGS